MNMVFRTPYAQMPRLHLHRFSPWAFTESDVHFPVDVKISDDSFKITALLPGLEADDISIQVVNETITLQGEFKYPVHDKANYLIQEIPGGKFCRTINLPDVLDASKAEAEMKDGVLTLHIPKAEATKPKTIKITIKQI
jgi:HSP20 family protein